MLNKFVFENDDEETLKDFAEKHDWKHALGDPNGDIEISYEVTGTPKVFIIDKDGQITYEAGGTTGKSVPDSPEDLELVK